MGLALITKILVILALYAGLMGLLEARSRRKGSRVASRAQEAPARAARRGGRVA